MIEVEQLYEILKQCWSIKTSSIYVADNPSKGQCSVTALLIYNKFGGSILKTKVNGKYHFYNQIDDQIVDLTSKQFSEPIHYENIISSAEEAQNDTTKKQYEHLVNQFVRIISQLENS